MVHIFLIWKDTEMPTEADRQQSLRSFEEDFADILEWETAEYMTNDALIYT